MASGSYPCPLDFCLLLVHSYSHFWQKLRKKINNLFLKLNTSIRSETFISQSSCSLLSNHLTHIPPTELIFGRSVCSWEINLSPPVILTVLIHIHLASSQCKHFKSLQNSKVWILWLLLCAIHQCKYFRRTTSFCATTHVLITILMFAGLTSFSVSLDIQVHWFSFTLYAQKSARSWVPSQPPNK